MNSEREILARLLEGRVEPDPFLEFNDKKDEPTIIRPEHHDITTADRPMINERTYTIGGTQYWKRGGKCYSWTEAGGRTEISEDDYMKALQGGSDNSSGNLGTVKNTSAKDDKSKADTKKDSPYSKYGFTRKPTEKKVGSVVGKYIIGDEARDITYVLTNRDGKIANIVNHDKRYVGGTYEGSVDRMMKKQDFRDYYQGQLDAGMKKVQKSGTEEEKNMMNYINDKWKDYVKNNPVESSRSIYDQADDIINDYHSDSETSFTQINKDKYLVELGDKDINNEKLISKLKDLGFKKHDGFRYIYTK